MTKLTFEHKYNIGDAVYYIDRWDAIGATIEGILCKKEEGATQVAYILSDSMGALWGANLEHSGSFPEDRLYKSKQEVLDLMEQRYNFSPKFKIGQNLWAVYSYAGQARVRNVIIKTVVLNREPLKEDRYRFAKKEAYCVGVDSYKGGSSFYDDMNYFSYSVSKATAADDTEKTQELEGGLLLGETCLFGTEEEATSVFEGAIEQKTGKPIESLYRGNGRYYDTWGMSREEIDKKAKEEGWETGKFKEDKENDR